MSYTTWTPLVVSSETQPWTASAWRIVESQHIASTMKIVDDPDEQDLLDLLLEGSKPPQPKEVGALDYLLATPFRYDPLPGSSHFRAVNDPSVFYAAQSVRTACAELGYWRWRFLKDAVDLDQLNPVAHTAFRTELVTTAVDLQKPPFNVDAPHWTNPNDYSVTQAFATAHAAKVGGIVYQSVRDPIHSWCVAALTQKAFPKRRPDRLTQTWWLAVPQDAVVWRHEHESLAFLAAPWTGTAT